MTCLLMIPSADHGEAFTIVCRKDFIGTHSPRVHLVRGLTFIVTLAISSGGLDLAMLGGQSWVTNSPLEALISFAKV